jgi:endonuclease III
VSTDPTKKLNTLLKKLRAQHADLAAPVVTPEPTDEFDPFVHQLMFSMLCWEASTAQARNALKRVRDSVVDYNELRVCVSDEVAHMIGDKYPLGLERAIRLRTTLNDIFNRQHGISLKHLPELSKREARQYLDSLPGCPSYVAARVCVTGGLGHAIPVDERLLDLLVEEGVLDAKMSVEQGASWLEHHVKAEESLEVHLLLQAWSDEQGHAPKRDKRPITLQTQAPEARHESRAEPRDSKDVKPSKTAGKGRTKPEPAAKKTKSKPRSGS